MSDRQELERRLRAHYAVEATPRPATESLRAILGQTAQIQPRPSWLARLQGDGLGTVESRTGRPPHSLVWVLLILALVVSLAAGLLFVTGGPRFALIGMPTASPSNVPSSAELETETPTPRPSIILRTAQSPLASLPTQPYRTAFQVPFTVELPPDWYLAEDSPSEVQFGYPEGPVLTIGRPAGYANAAALLKAWRTQRLNVGPGEPQEARMSVDCPELLHPMPAKVAGLTGFRVWCYGWQRDFTAFYPVPVNPSYAPVPAIPSYTPSAWELTHAGGMFGLPKCCSGTFFVADVHDTPVVISLVDPGGLGPGSYAMTFLRAQPVLRTVRFSP